LLPNYPSLPPLPPPNYVDCISILDKFDAIELDHWRYNKNNSFTYTAPAVLQPPSPPNPIIILTPLCSKCSLTRMEQDVNFPCCFLMFFISRGIPSRIIFLILTRNSPKPRPWKKLRRCRIWIYVTGGKENRYSRNFWYGQSADLLSNSVSDDESLAVRSRKHATQTNQTIPILLWIWIWSGQVRLADLNIWLTFFFWRHLKLNDIHLLFYHPKKKKNSPWKKKINLFNSSCIHSLSNSFFTSFHGISSIAKRRTIRIHNNARNKKRTHLFIPGLHNCMLSLDLQC